MSAYSGPCKIKAANATIDSKVIRCDITVGASGLVIKNSYVHGSVSQEGGSPSFTVLDSLINGASPYVRASAVVSEAGTSRSCAPKSSAPTAERTASTAV